MHVTQVCFLGKIMTCWEFAQIRSWIEKDYRKSFKKLYTPSITPPTVIEYGLVWVMFSELRKETRSTRDWKKSFKHCTQEKWTSSQMRQFVSQVRRFQHSYGFYSHNNRMEDD